MKRTSQELSSSAIETDIKVAQLRGKTARQEPCLGENLFGSTPVFILQARNGHALTRNLQHTKRDYEREKAASPNVNTRTGQPSPRSMHRGA
jgi:hypothetical protein